MVIETGCAPIQPVIVIIVHGLPVDQNSHFGIIVGKRIAIVTQGDFHPALIDAALHKRGNFRSYLGKTIVINSVAIDFADLQHVVGKRVFVVDPDGGGVLSRGHAVLGRLHLQINMRDIGLFRCRRRQAHGREQPQHHGDGQ